MNLCLLQVPGSNMMVSRQNRVSSGRTLQKRLNAKNLALLPPVGNNSKASFIHLSVYCFLTYEIQFVLFLAVLENSVLLMG